MIQHPPPYYPPPRKKSKLPWILGGILAAVFGAFLLVMILALGLSNSAKPKNASAPASVSPSTSKPAAPPAAAAPSSTKPAGPLRTVSDGTYKVGTDMEAGTYRSEGSKLCFWQRMKDASGEIDAVIANHIGDGPQVVTVKAGEYFEVNRCTFTKS